MIHFILFSFIMILEKGSQNEYPLSVEDGNLCNMVIFVLANINTK